MLGKNGGGWRVGGTVTVDMARNGSTMVFFYRKIDKKFCAVLLLR